MKMPCCFLPLLVVQLRAVQFALTRFKEPAHCINYTLNMTLPERIAQNTAPVWRPNA